MVNIFKPQRKPQGKAVGANNVGSKKVVKIAKLDQHGQGISADHQPIMFVDGVLPNETVEVVITEHKARMLRAKVLNVLEASPYRQVPFCQHFSQCGGCQTQFCASDAMLNFKQQAIEQQILHTPIGTGNKSNKPAKRGLVKSRKQSLSAANSSRTIADKMTNLPWVNQIQGDVQQYRRKTRLAIDARNPQDIRIGYRGKADNKVFSLQECPVLVADLQKLIEPIKAAIQSLQSPAKIAHIAMLKGDRGIQVNLRQVKPLSSNDHTILTKLAQRLDIQIVLEGSEQHQQPLNGEHSGVQFSPVVGVLLEAQMDDFIQVNQQINGQMIVQAIDWLQLSQDDTVLDLFCGIGNFSLPMAQRCKQVIGVEGVAKMVQRAKHNALSNHIENCRFEQADLAQTAFFQTKPAVSYQKVLLDPAREGALEAVSQLAKRSLSHIVYVSCNPATFARDAAKLLEGNYRIEKISLMDMFPQTAHTELMALFVPDS
ncbi:23S rRNA (uracil(1939)-C(5))-methyltransferase RlmD [Aliiglaciecola sp. LCG003]|uniref:23S rRNA (uracil(1939)-C(5))-methyltransferase RlmD n=1 Tax=Aliiglaciecola sp. LCG003 TaxID=3053655 RepID=UPI0025723EEE|nr:23S rRNA (uracil(1939)-C(5))-methyltransferase RlmD [Aliiglaciecola sp. LCG003]WJG08714.1 23S rRNA (uracil(1939)-C(5))-methyltransferase RlmD [Aliiglaciecola sp. LCG003]